MSRKSDPFIGPTWAKFLLGWSLLLLGGLLALLSVGVLVAGILFGFWSETDRWAESAITAFWAGLFGVAAVAGWRILRAPQVRAKGKGPRGSLWVAVGAIAMIPLLWLLTEVFLGPSPLPPSSAYVTLAWWVLFLLSLPALKRYEAVRGSRIRWWEWGLVQGLLAGSAGGLEIFLAARGFWPTALGGLAIGLVFFGTIGGYFLWWGKVGREWYLQQGGRLRWPFS